MSEEAVETETVETETVEDPTPEAPKPTETVEFWKTQARKNEDRAKSNADKAKELDELKAAALSKEEKEAQERAELRRERDEARAEALRSRIATRHGISEEDTELFLTGTDEETLTRQAERLVERTPVPSKGTHVPGVGNQPPKPPTQAEQIRAAEAAGDTQQAMSLKAQQLADLTRKHH